MQEQQQQEQQEQQEQQQAVDQRVDFRGFESEERDSAGGPLAHGLLADCSRATSAARADDGGDVGELQNALVASAIRRRRADKALSAFPAPYLLMDLCDAKDIGLQPAGGPAGGPAGPQPAGPQPAGSQPAGPQPSGMLRMLIPASFVVDLGSISSDRVGGMSVVKCNAALPVYRWFLAANLLLEHHGELGRVVPFPMDQPAADADDEGIAQPAMTIFQFMRVTQTEHAEYKKLLDFAISTEGLERGFVTAARFSYEILRKRTGQGSAPVALEHAEVDRAITRVILKNPSSLDCVLFTGLDEDPSSDAELLKCHAVMRC
jgi:hypothetical protein